MARQQLFYENVTPVNTTRHRDLCIDGDAKYEFAKQVNAVPIVVVEMPQAARDYAIVFAGDDSVVPVVLVGVEADANLYIGEDGSWSADYVPAFVRRYPFVFSQSDDGSTFTLCVDEEWRGCNRDGRGEPLFDEDGGRTPYLENKLGFVQEYQKQFNRTRAFCDRLKELDLLETMKADFTLDTGEKRSVVGFMAVNRDRLNALPAETLSELARNDELELVYIHLLSMGNFGRMLERAAAAQSESPTGAPGEPDSSEAAAATNEEDSGGEDQDT